MKSKMKQTKRAGVRLLGYISAMAAEAGKLGCEAMTVFICGMGSATLAAVAWLCRLAEAVAVDPLGAESYYAPMLEYIMMAYLIVIAGTLAFDLLARSCKQHGGGK